MSLVQIGIISDTHGLLRKESLQALDGVELIIHAGDVGNREIIDRLAALAPVVFVRGNIDEDAWAADWPETAVAEAGGVKIYVLHDIGTLNLDPVSAGFHIVVSGHSHQPSRTERSGVVYLNPGSAGPRRFKLPVTLARLDLGRVPWQLDFVDLLHI